MTEFHLAHPRSFNTSDLGTQKTGACLWAADAVMQARPGRKCLIVAPLSSIHDVWAHEIQHDFMGRRTCAILHGTAAQRSKALAKDVDFYVINWDGPAIGARRKGNKIVFGGFTLELMRKEGLDIIIYDEVTVLGDPRSVRSRVAFALFKNKPFIWAITGTPASQRPDQAYGPAKLVNDAKGLTFTAFRDSVMINIDGKWLRRPNHKEKVAELLQPAVRFTQEECTDLPEMFPPQDRFAKLSDMQKTALTDLKREMQVKLESGTITAIGEGALRTKALQICCGFLYDNKHMAHALDCKSRLAVLDEIVEQCERKILVFAPFTAAVEMLYNHLRKNHECCMVHGGVAQKQRHEYFSAFQQPDSPLRIIVAQASTMAHSLTLTEANVTIWYAPIDCTETYAQSNKRTHRPGQEYPTSYFHIYSSALEKEIYKRRAEDIEIQGAILKLLEEK